MNINNIEYKVLEDKRIVIATIRAITFDPIMFFRKKFLSHATASLDMLTFSDQKFCMPYTMRAIAKCDPNDEFDVEKGKAIARKKLVEKYNLSMDKHMLHYRNAMKKCLDHMDAYLKKHKMI